MNSVKSNLTKEPPHSPTSHISSHFPAEPFNTPADDFYCLDERVQPTWSPPFPLLGAKEFDSREDVESTGFVTASFGFTGAADAPAGIGLLPLPRLPFLSDEGTGDRCSHGQFGSDPGGETSRWSVKRKQYKS